MPEELPPLPRRRKGRGLTIGPGEFWWKIWKEEYHDEGGRLGYENWLEAQRDLRRKYKKRQKK